VTKSRLYQLGLGIIPFLLYSLVVTTQINLVPVDLGRHLRNGALLVQAKNFAVLKENLYSFTYSDFPFLNHHWGSGVAFYLIQKLAGFKGLSFFFTLLSLATLGLFFDVARKTSSLVRAVWVLILIIPVLVSRSEIRPEAFSAFFSGLFFWLLWHYHQQKIKPQWLFLLPILEVFWVNLHIYFFLGPVVIGGFLLSNLRQRRALGFLALILFLSGLACFLNPAGFKGALYPLNIFNGYSYPLFENQSVWFLDKVVQYPLNLYFKIVFALLILSWIYALIKRSNFAIYYLLFTIFFSYLGWTAVRNFALFALFALPIITANLQNLHFKNLGSEVKIFLSLSVPTLALFLLFILNPSYWITKIRPGLGLMANNAQAADFFKKNQLRGPIFNNYDNGGYLIYYLYPEKVFVDNRPEAYPSDFFQKTYIPMQEDNKKWQEEDQKYHFETIFFYRHDLTPWGQQFLVNRIGDGAWVPVYVDDWSIIFVKRTEKNKEIIKNFELPKGMFSISK